MVFFARCSQFIDRTVMCVCIRAPRHDTTHIDETWPTYSTSTSLYEWRISFVTVPVSFFPLGDGAPTVHGKISSYIGEGSINHDTPSSDIHPKYDCIADPTPLWSKPLETKLEKPRKLVLLAIDESWKALGDAFMIRRTVGTGYDHHDTK